MSYDTLRTDLLGRNNRELTGRKQRRRKHRRKRRLVRNLGQTLRGKRRRKHKAGQAAPVGRNGAGRVRMNEHAENLDNILHRPESSDWVAAVLGLEKPPNNEHAIWSRRP